MPFCAICTSECGPFTRQPLGRGNALVNVCAECDDGHPVADDGPDRSYEPTGGLPSYQQSQRGIERALGADYERLTRLENAVSLAPSPRTDDYEISRGEAYAEIVRRDRAGCPLTVNRERNDRKSAVKRGGA